MYDEVKQYISQRLKELSNEHDKKVYECCKKNITNELLDIELYIETLKDDEIKQLMEEESVSI